MVVASLSRCLQVYTSLSPDVLVRGKVVKSCVATLLDSRLEGSIRGKEEKRKSGKHMSGNIGELPGGTKHQCKDEAKC